MRQPKQKTFLVKGKIRWGPSNFLIFILCAVVADFVYFCFNGSHGTVLIPAAAAGYFIMGLAYASNPQEILGVLLICSLLIMVSLLMILVVSFPIILIYQAIKRAVQRQEIMRATYDADLGIEYFREPIKSWSPGLLNAVSSLQIDRQSALAATILDMQQRNALTLDETGIHLKESPDDLPQNEAVLFSLLQNTKEITGGLLKTWEKAIFAEATDKKLLKRTKDKRRLKQQAKTLILISFVAYCLLYLFAEPITMRAQSAMDALVYDPIVYEALVYGENGFIGYVQALGRPAMIELLVAMIQCVLFVALMICGIAAPVSLIGTLVAYKVRPDKYVRTKLGNRLAEQSNALYNFIHQYSNLSEAEQEHLTLWGPYLVYAVALGENKKVLSDISEIIKKGVIL